MSIDLNLLATGAAIAGGASGVLYATRRRWPDAALASAAGISLATLLASQGAPVASSDVATLATEGSTTSAAGGDAALAAAMLAIPRATSVRVEGHGLHEAQWRDLPPRPVQWQEPAADLLWLDFPRTLPLGRNFTLSVRRSQPQAGWRLQLLAENGQVLSESRGNSAQLSVQWQPPLAESMVLQARVLDAAGKVVAQGPVPLQVEAPVPLQVQGRFGAPSFDARVLNQLLTDGGARIDWQTTLGKAIARNEAPGAPLAAPNALVADAAYVEKSPARGALLAQAGQGVPLLVLGGNAEDAALWQRELGLALAPQSATTEQDDMRHFALAGATLALSPAPLNPLASNSAPGAWKTLAADKDGKPWLWQREWRKGRILWLGVADWHRAAITAPAALGQWWQLLLDHAALGSVQKLRWQLPDAMPLAGLRTEVCAQGVQLGGAAGPAAAAPAVAPPMVQAGEQTLAWQIRSDKADAACVALWPGKAGWMAVRSGDAATQLYVYGANDWPAWQKALRHDATARYAARSPAAEASAVPAPSARAAQAAPGAAPAAGGGAGAGFPGAAVASMWRGVAAVLPRWLSGLLFAGALLCLWWRERR